MKNNGLMIKLILNITTSLLPTNFQIWNRNKTSKIGYACKDNRQCNSSALWRAKNCIAVIVSYTDQLLANYNSFFWFIQIIVSTLLRSFFFSILFCGILPILEKNNFFQNSTATTITAFNWQVKKKTLQLLTSCMVLTIAAEIFS